MKRRIVKIGGKYKWKFSLDAQDWIGLLVVILLACVVLLGEIMRG